MGKKNRPARNTSTEKTVLVLQGGGALGAYQAGVYEALAAAALEPGWIAGISIGALNAALIAGNPPERRVARLREFWESVSSDLLVEPPIPGEDARILFNEASAALSMAFGRPGFFAPRLPPAMAYPPGAPEALSFYDTTPLRKTLSTLVDFELLNGGPIRISLGSVNLRSGNFAYFDSAEQEIRPDHIMASGALLPAFPPIEIDGQCYWDGGLVSNTPLQYVLDDVPRRDMLVFQVDLFSARGPMPRNLSEVRERAKDIRFSSRTRLNTDVFRERQTLRRAIYRLLAKLPDNLKSDPDVQFLAEQSCNAAVTIVHLIHRRNAYSTQSKDYEFSRHSIEEHWAAGGNDVRRSLRHDAWQSRTKPESGVTVFDLIRDGRD